MITDRDREVARKLTIDVKSGLSIEGSVAAYREECEKPLKDLVDEYRMDLESLQRNIPDDRL